MTVSTTTVLTQVDDDLPASGYELVAVAITLDNQGDQVAPLTPSAFSIAFTSGLSYAGSVDTADYPSGCDASASVVGGAATSCSIVFEVPKIGTSTTLDYATSNGAMRPRP